MGERLGSPEKMSTTASWRPAEVLHVRCCLWFHSVWFILVGSHDEKTKHKNETCTNQSQSVSALFVCERALRFGFTGSSEA